MIFYNLTTPNGWGYGIIVLKGGYQMKRNDYQKLFNELLKLNKGVKKKTSHFSNLKRQSVEHSLSLTLIKVI